MNQRILIDYFVASWKIQSDDEKLRFFHELDKPPGDWEIIKSYYGCSVCYYYDGIKIHVSDDLLILDCSGKGCRTLEREFEWNWENKLLEWKSELTQHQPLEPPRMHIARLDVACDLLDNDQITIKKISECVLKHRFVCKSQVYLVTEGSNEEAVYFGSPRSDRRLRIYDKALEQRRQGKEPESDLWVRFEFQLRNDNALSFILNFYQQEHFGNTFYGVLHDYVNFTQLPVMEIMMREKQL